MAAERRGAGEEVAPRPAVELGLEANFREGNVRVWLNIDNKPLAAAAVGGLAIAVGVFFYRNQEVVGSAIRSAFAGLCEVQSITGGSILVELKCETEQSFLSFMEAFETKKIKQRLEEEFEKIGFKEELEVSIRNDKEVYEELDRIRRDRIQRERIAQKEEGDIQKDQGGLAKVGDAAYGRKPRAVSSFGTYGSSVEKGVSMLDIEEDSSLKTVFSKLEKQQLEVEGKEISKIIPGFEGKHVRGSSFEVQIQTSRFRPVLSFGELGESVGKLYRPCGVAVNNRNEIAVAEWFNHRVSVFSSDGTHLSSFGRRGRNPGEFNCPSGIAFDNNGNIIVADRGNNRIQVFNGNGKFLAKFGEEGFFGRPLLIPEGLSVTSNGDIIVPAKRDKLIKIFSPRGQFKRKFGGQDSFCLPCHCIQTEQYFIVSDEHEHCIKVFDLGGNFVFKFGKEGNKEGEFNSPGYLSVNKDGHLMVCDLRNNRVQLFELSGKFVAKFGRQGNEIGEFDYPTSTANLSDGRIVVSDCFNHRVQIFELI